MKNKLKGITLIETILYVGIFSIVLVSIMNFMFSAQETTRKTNIRADVHQSVEFVNQHISDTFKNSQSVEDLLSLYNIDNGVLVIQTKDGQSQYQIQDSRLYFNDSPITPKNMSVSKLYLEPAYDSDGTTIGVKITSVVTSRIDSSIAEDINILAVLR
ncbi:MAG: hypothetical protein PHE21_01960 [Candidatus Dojkabacteria bacterium]|nr:hypothetical protein [Candidatus Dojkabacteria bacterium]